MHGPTRGQRGTLATSARCPGETVACGFAVWPRTMATPRGLGLSSNLADAAVAADGALAAAITAAAVSVRFAALNMSALSWWMAGVVRRVGASSHVEDLVYGQGVLFVGDHADRLLCGRAIGQTVRVLSSPTNQLPRELLCLPGWSR
jgi:hypothetical protein